jgi:hypothetical protein
MAPKNIDETVKKLLNGYAKWCSRILAKDAKALQKRKFLTSKDRLEAVQEYTSAKNAYEYLLQIAANPKKYLYTGQDLFRSKVVDYHKLLPILSARFDRGGKHLFVRLCEKIAYHVEYESRFNDNNGVWVYHGNSGMLDLNAEAIIKMNKTVALWNSNDFVAAIKDFAFPSAFAVDMYKKER